MTTNYHTPIANGAAANNETFNAPLSELDTKLTNHETRIGDLESEFPAASGNPTEYLDGDGNWTVPTGTGASVDGHVIQDEGIDLPQRAKVNFVGAGVTVTNEAGGTQVSIPADYLTPDGLKEWTEQGSNPSTPGSGKWRLYFKAGGLYLIDDAGNVNGPLSVSDPTNVTVTTANVTAVENKTYNLTIGGLTANRNFVLPAPSRAGVEITANILDGDDTYFVILIGDTGVTINGGSAATEYKRFRGLGESITFRSTSTTNWAVVSEVGTWVTFTPDWLSTGVAPSIGDGTLLGKYFRLGKKVTYKISITFGSTTSGGTGAWLIGLPFTAAEGGGSYAEPAGATLNDTSVGQYIGQGVRYSTTQMYVITDAVPGGIGATSPFTWVTGDSLLFLGEFEAA